MFKGGIFLPLDEHVARYCRTANFGSCQQYLQGCPVLQTPYGNMSSLAMISAAITSGC